jgi:hypothetical protein
MILDIYERHHFHFVVRQSSDVLMPISLPGPKSYFPIGCSLRNQQVEFHPAEIRTTYRILFKIGAFLVRYSSA